MLGEEIQAQQEIIQQSGMASPLLDLMQEVVLITNASRQIVYANRAALALAGDAIAMSHILGMRPGEAFRCVHAVSTHSQCGLTQYCSQCGSMFSLISSRSGNSGSYDFSLSRYEGDQIESLDLKIFGGPIAVKETTFYFLIIADVSHEKRRRALERIFFHDILNLAGGIHGLMRLLKNQEIKPDSEILELLYQNADYLMREIQTQKILRSAEQHELKPVFDDINALTLLQNVIGLYQHHPLAKDKKIEISPGTPAIMFESDQSLAGRVIGNMVKNALEASRKGDVIAAGVRSDAQYVEFWVNNSMAMPKEVQLQVFQRSFSTKGGNRGLGTYGMKLLSERYLGGTVSFISGPGGTTFYARYPLRR